VPTARSECAAMYYKHPSTTSRLYPLDTCSFYDTSTTVRYLYTCSGGQVYEYYYDNNVNCSGSPTYISHLSSYECYFPAADACSLAKITTDDETKYRVLDECFNQHEYICDGNGDVVRLEYDDYNCSGDGTASYAWTIDDDTTMAIECPFTPSPTTHPTTHPTTAQPTVTPTVQPSSVPTATPTVQPSSVPTAPPSAAPSQAPTFYPIARDAYSQFVEIECAIYAFTTTDLGTIGPDIAAFVQSLAYIIELGFNDEDALTFKDIDVNVTAIGGEPIEELRAATFMAQTELMSITSIVECSEAICSYIALRYQTGTPETYAFEQFVTDKLNERFRADTTVDDADADADTETDESLRLAVISVSDAMELYPSAESAAASDETVFFALLSFCVCLILLGFAACAFNKSRCANSIYAVDEARWTAIIAIALQIWDFASDVTLSLEMWSRRDVLSNTLVLVSAVGSSLFVVIPYMANLIVAASIKRFVRGNEAARTWFRTKAPIFTALVVVTGGAYPALSVVSSKCFGLSMLSCGLTRYELRSLLNIKIYSSVLLENVPQLIFQALYVVAIGEATDTAVFATVASVLSVISALLGFVIERRDDSLQIAQYFIRFGRGEAGSQITPTPTPTSPSSVSGTAESKEQNANELSSAERFKILCNRGRTRALSFALSAVWDIDPKRIEVGATTLSKFGARTHIVHHIYGSVDGADRTDVMFYAQQRFAASAEDVAAVFRKHFGLGADFAVHFEAKSDNFAVDRVAHLESVLASYLQSSPEVGAQVLNVIKDRVDSASRAEQPEIIEMQTPTAQVEGDTKIQETTKASA